VILEWIGRAALRTDADAPGAGRTTPASTSDVKPFIYSQRENRRILPEILEVKEDSATNRCVLEYSRPWFSACLDASRFVTRRKKNRMWRAFVPWNSNGWMRISSGKSPTLRRCWQRTTSLHWKTAVPTAKWASSAIT